jgi:hypothetical protein
MSNKKRCYCGPRECVHPSTLLPDYYCAVQCDAPVAPRPPEQAMRSPMSDQVSAVRARVEAAALEYHKATDGTGEGEYGCPGLSCPGVQRLANFWTPIVEAALRAVPLSAETEGLRDKIADAWWAGRQSVRQWSVESASGPQLIAACDDLINKLLAAPTVAQAPQADESELDRLVAEYKHIADNNGEHRVKDLVWLINELIYERDRKDKP